MSASFLGFGSEQSLRHIGAALADGLFTTNVEGRVTYWNSAAERITGWSAAEALGTSCSILAGDSLNGCACGAGPIHCGLAMQERRSKQCTIRRKDRSILTIVKSAVALRDETGAVVGALESFAPVNAPALSTLDGAPALTGWQSEVKALNRLVQLVAVSDSTVLISGECGTGKRRVAEAIHRLSPRASRPFVKVRCADLDEANGGAPERHWKRIMEASGGTVLFEELADLSVSQQANLLRYVEEREALRAADFAGSGADARLLCTTESDLRALVGAKRFRADLYFRLEVFPLRMPTLRDRIEDVPAIAEQFLSALTPPVLLTPEAGYVLLGHRWPGNVRELENALRFAAMCSGGRPVKPEHLPHDVAAHALNPQPAAVERAELVEALARCKGNRMLAARTLGISRVTLWKRMKRLGVER